MNGIQPLATEVSIQQGTVVVAVRGELDLSTIDALDATVGDMARYGSDIVLDLTELTFLDSTGLRTILTAVETARSQGAAVSIVPGPVHVHRVFELTGTDRALTFVS